MKSGTAPVEARGEGKVGSAAMADRVLLDVTPLGSGHGARGIGTYLRGLMAGFRELGADRRPELLADAGQPLATGFESHLVRIPSWSVPRVPSPWPRYFGGRAVKRIAPKVFHATSPDLVPRAECLVVTCHDLIPLHFAKDYLAGPGRMPERRAFDAYLKRLQRADRIIVPSLETRNDLVRDLGVESGRLRVIPHARLPQVFPAGATPVGPYVLYGGGVEPHKNAALTLEALAATTSSVKLVVVGPWSPRRGERLRERAREVGVESRVHWLGYVPSARLAALRQQAVAVLVPSHKEGFGFPVIEAMAARVPVIASDTPALREVGGQAAIYRAPDDPAGWARMIDTLVGSPVMRRARSAAGAAQAARFSWTTAAEQTAAVYAELL